VNVQSVDEGRGLEEHDPRRHYASTLRPAGARSGSRPLALLAFQWFGGAFTVAAATVAIANTASPFARGWWLVAFLFLVGGVSQVGQFRLAARAAADPPPAALLWTQLVLWNAGTVAVAAADMAVEPAAVAAGSVALMVALCLFTAGARRWRAGTRNTAGSREAAYTALVVCLAACVVIGTFLADAVPGQ